MLEVVVKIILKELSPHSEMFIFNTVSDYERRMQVRLSEGIQYYH